MWRKEKEWAVIGASACLTLYGAWLYLQPGRKLPPLRSTTECRFVDTSELTHTENGEWFVVVCCQQRSVVEFDENPLCVANLTSTSKTLDSSWKAATSTEICFRAIDSIRCHVVTSDQFTLDALCSTFIFVHPKIAFGNRHVLIDIAKGMVSVSDGSDATRACRIRYIIHKLVGRF